MEGADTLSQNIEWRWAVGMKARVQTRKESLAASLVALLQLGMRRIKHCRQAGRAHTQIYFAMIGAMREILARTIGRIGHEGPLPSWREQERWVRESCDLRHSPRRLCDAYLQQQRPAWPFPFLLPISDDEDLGTTV